MAKTTKRKPLTHTEFSRRGGSAKTAAQNAARKKNAQRAGRPKRVCIHCGEPVRGGHVDQELDRKCGAHGWRWQKPHEPAPASSPTSDQVLDKIAAIVNAANAKNEGATDVDESYGIFGNAVDDIGKVLIAAGRQVRP